MPPPVGRYGPSALNAPFAHLQQAHQLQQQQTQHHAAHTQSVNPGLPPPSLGHPGFAAASSNSNLNPFGLATSAVANGVSMGGFGDAGNGTGLASHAAQMGFVRGAQMQQQQQLHQTQDGRLVLEGKSGSIKSRIRDVWKHNLAQEMATLRQLVDRYPYISMVGLGHPNFLNEFSLMMFILGHRVSRYRCTAYGSFHHKSRLPLPNSPL